MIRPGLTLTVLVAVGCGGGAGAGVDGSPSATDGATDAPPDALAIVEPVHFIGRFDRTDPAAPRFAWPGTQLATRFTGTDLSIELDDGGANWFDVSVDGAAPVPVQLLAGDHVYPVATGLAAGEHDVVVARRTESFEGPTTFRGFSGGTLVPTARRARLVEMIGDSITCGYGVLGAGPSCGFAAATEAETHAWGALAATALGADHVAIAYSGIGIARNNDGGTASTMAVQYLRTIADDAASTWDFSYTPDVIVVDLGTNDFAQGDPGAAYVTAYTVFVQTVLRAHFPGAYIVLATSPMLSDSFPQGAHARTTARGYLDAIATQLADPRVQVVEIAEQRPADGYGCDYHPDEVTQQKMATTLVAAIRAATGW